MTDDERRELRDLMQAHDQMMTEHQEWMAAREAAAASPVQKSDADGLVYRTINGNAPAPVPPADPALSDGDVARLMFDDPDLDERFRACMVRIIVELRAEWRQKIDEEGRQWRKQVGMLKNQFKAVQQDAEIDRANGIEVY